MGGEGVGGIKKGRKECESDLFSSTHCFTVYSPIIWVGKSAMCIGIKKFSLYSKT